MDLIEPEIVYARRCGSVAASGPPAPHQPRGKPYGHLGDDFWTTAVFDVLRENGDEPMQITSLVNAVGKLGNYTRRADYDARRVALLKLVSKLIREARLDRVVRKHVIIPRSDARRKAFLEAAAQPLDLPAPQL